MKLQLRTSTPISQAVAAFQMLHLNNLIKLMLLQPI